MTRRSFVGVLVGLAFAAAAGVGLAQVTTGSAPSSAVASTTESQTTSTAGDFESKSADDQESEESDFDSESDENEHQTSTTLSMTSTTPLTSTTGDDAVGASGNGQQKMDVCHKTGSGKKHTINIAAPAVPAHVAHGDTEGACVAASMTTSQSSSTPTTHGHKPHKLTKPKKEHGSNHGRAGSAAHGNSKHGKGQGK